MTTIEVIGLENVIRDVEAHIGSIVKKTRTAVNLAGNQMKTDVQDKAPYHTGTYRRSIHAEPGGTRERPEVRVGTNLIYAKQKEFGGFIYAKNSPWLTFRTYDGAWHKVKQVYQHPQPHFRPVADLNGPKYMEMIREYLEDDQGYMPEWESAFSMFQTVSGGTMFDSFGGVL